MHFDHTFPIRLRSIIKRKFDETNNEDELHFVYKIFYN